MFTIIIRIADGHDFKTVVFHGVVVENGDQANGWAIKAIKQLGMENAAIKIECYRE